MATVRMTLLLAGMAETGEVILAADTRTQVGPPGGPFNPSSEEKIYSVGGCVIASAGANPAGLHVPTLVREFANVTRTPFDLANALHDRICRRSLPTDYWSLLVAGSGKEHIELWEALPPNGVARVPLDIGEVLSRGTPVYFSNLPRFDTTLELETYVHYVLRQVTERVPTRVGPPFDLFTLRFGKPASLKKLAD